MDDTRYKRTLHIANLQAWMDEAYLKNCFEELGNEIVRVKIVTVASEGYKYGFIEFTSLERARSVLKRYHGTKMPNASQHFVLNWSKGKQPLPTQDASEGGILGKGPLTTQDTSEGGNYKLVVAGAFPKDVTAEELQQHFSIHFPSVKDAEVHTNESQEFYGVITFADEHERDLATILMPGQVFKRTGDSKPRHFFYKDTADEYKKAAYPEDADPNGSTMYIQNLRNGVSEGSLRLKFSPYGEVTKVTIRASALIQFSDRLSVNKALLDMNDGLILQNACLPFTVRKSNEKVKEWKQKEKEKQVVFAFSGQADEEILLSESVGRSSADKTLPHMNDDSVLQNSVESPKDLNELPLENEEFRTCDEELSDEKVAEEGKQNEEGTEVADAFSRQADEETLLSKFVDRSSADETLPHMNDDSVLQNSVESPKDLNELPLEDEEFRTCDEELSDEKVAEGKQNEEGTEVADAFSRQADEETLLSKFVDRSSADETLPHMNDDSVLQNSVESPKDLNELPLEDEEFRTCDEELSDEKVAEGKQNEEGTEVADAFSRQADEETLLSKFVDRSSADETLLHMNDDPVLKNSLLPLTVRKSNGIKTDEQKQRRREKKKGQRARKKERDKLAKQSTGGLEESGGQRINEGSEASERLDTNDGSEESEGEESNEGDQSVISWLLDLCVSLWQHWFRLEEKPNVMQQQRANEEKQTDLP